MAVLNIEEQARRLARAIASDISLFSEEKIIKAIRSGDDILVVMAEEIYEGRMLYNRRVDQKFHSTNIFDTAIDQLVVQSRKHIKRPVKNG